MTFSISPSTPLAYRVSRFTDFTSRDKPNCLAVSQLIVPSSFQHSSEKSPKSARRWSAKSDKISFVLALRAEMRFCMARLMGGFWVFFFPASAALFAEYPASLAACVFDFPRATPSTKSCSRSVKISSPFVSRFRLGIRFCFLPSIYRFRQSQSPMPGIDGVMSQDDPVTIKSLAEYNTLNLLAMGGKQSLHEFP